MGAKHWRDGGFLRGMEKHVLWILNWVIKINGGIVFRYYCLLPPQPGALLVPAPQLTSYNYRLLAVGYHTTPKWPFLPKWSWYAYIASYYLTLILKPKFYMYIIQLLARTSTALQVTTLLSLTWPSAAHLHPTNLTPPLSSSSKTTYLGVKGRSHSGRSIQSVMAHIPLSSRCGGLMDSFHRTI